ncbi:uncharacterized protein Dwil_GK15215 [Drosophila willistoni]|uniref:Transposase Tc1-like domain-containing protein n=1 Tax=Drosophila willistoni TaxID=7260 RepID=B4MW91_DROWI|nr:uncharacterized protein LOC6642774 [Drosophila willistoni]EDW75961.1 uncharacterized protein Dwil_GK15215 [Drosophila willistoni]
MALNDKTNSSAMSCKNVSNPIKCRMGNDGKAMLLRLPSIRRDVGRPKIFENSKLIKSILLDNPNFTSIDVKRKLESLHGITMSRRTVQRRISEIRTKQLELQDENEENFEIGHLSKEAKKRRLEWALAHQDWTVQDWRNVFNLNDIKFISGNLTPKQICADSLLGPEGTANDLNLLEQLMSIIEPKIRELPHAPKNINQFRKTLYNIWDTDQEMMDKIELLYVSMTWRVASVIKSGGEESDF